MKILIALALVFSAAVLTAQTANTSILQGGGGGGATSITTLLPGVDYSEPIPDYAVEPLYVQQVYTCPRDEYKIRWYIQKKEAEYYTYSGSTLTYSINSGSWITATREPSPKYRFVAVCVPR